MALASSDVQAIERADTPAKAAALRDRLQAERATAAADRQGQIDDAIELLRGGYSDNELDGARSRNSAPHGPRRRPANSGGSAPRRSSPGRQTAPARKPAKQKRSRAARAGRRVARETASSVEPVGDLVLKILGASIAFSVFYLLISNAGKAGSGKAAIDLMAGSFRTGLNAFVLPVDPLNPSGKPAPGELGGVAGAIAGAIDAAPQTTQPTQTHTAPKGTK